MASKMMAGLEFASRSPWRKATVVLLVVSAVLSGYALLMRHKLLERRAAVLIQLEAQQAEGAKARPIRQAPARPEATDEASRLVAGLQRPWEPMLNALQASIRDDVVVNRVQPETDAFRLRISDQADTSQAFVEFVQRLRSDSSWHAVEPVSEAKQVDNANPGGKPIVFQLAAEWNRQ